jgi:hypothetical protein
MGFIDGFFTYTLALDYVSIFFIPKYKMSNNNRNSKDFYYYTKIDHCPSY